MAQRERAAAAQAQARSRAERSRPAAAAVPVPVPAAPPVEVVSGRLGEAEWRWLLSAEQAEEAVGDLLAALLDHVLQRCYDAYLARQCVPYVINQAREAMLQIIEWRFLVRDEGELAISADPTWREDEEPQASIVDSWAQGSVPVLQARLHLQEEEVPPAERCKEATAPQEVPCDTGPAAPRVEERSWLPSQEAAQLAKGLLVPTLEPSPLIQASTSFKARKGGPSVCGSRIVTWLQSNDVPLCPAEKHLLLPELSQDSVEGKSRGMPRTPCPLLPPSCSNLLRIQLGRPPTLKNVLYDEAGNITTVPRLDAARLPKRWVKPHVEVMDPDAELPRQEALKTISAPHQKGLRSLAPWVGADPRDRGRQAVLGDGLAEASRKQLSKQVGHLPPPPGRTLELTSLIFVKPTLLVETLELAPGVTVRGGGSSWRGVRPTAPPEERDRVHKTLKPMSPGLPFLPTVAVEKVVQEP